MGSQIVHPSLDMPLSSLFEAVKQMDRLNSFARHPDCSYELSRQIYRLKDQVVKACDEVGAITSRIISVKVKCKSCHGSGRWGRRHIDLCNQCGGVGRHDLYFREIRIGQTLMCQEWPESLDEIRWHSPRTGRDAREAAETAQPVNDWAPRQPGRELSADEIASALNILETLFVFPPIFPYGMHLGELPSEFCAFCQGKSAEGDAFDARFGVFRWGARICAGCREHFHETGRQYSSVLPIPLHLFTPAMKIWAERHGGIKRMAQVACRMDEWGDGFR